MLKTATERLKIKTKLLAKATKIAETGSHQSWRAVIEQLPDDERRWLAIWIKNPDKEALNSTCEAARWGLKRRG